MIYLRNFFYEQFSSFFSFHIFMKSFLFLYLYFTRVLCCALITIVARLVKSSQYASFLSYLFFYSVSFLSMGRFWHWVCREKRLFNLPPQFSRLGTQCPAFPFLFMINPRHACAVRVTVLGLCVCLSVCLRLLALQAAKRHQSDTNSSSATSARKLNKQFC